MPKCVPRAADTALRVLLLSLAACSATEGDPTTAEQRRLDLPPFQAPPTTRADTTDDYHGTSVADPYRWLEDQGSADTAAFVAAQNAASRAFLDALPARAEIRARLEELWNFPRTTPPQRHGTHWFWTHNDGLQNQSVWFTAEGSDLAPDAAGRVLLDPNLLSADGTVALAGFEPTDDGKLVAYATSASGSDWQEWHVLDVATGQALPDRLQWAKFTRAAWTHSGDGFFYQRYPAPKQGEVFEAANTNPQLCYHKVGTEQSADQVVYERPDEPQWAFDAEVTESGRFVVITMRNGTDRRNRIGYADLNQEGWPVQPLLMDFDAHYDFLGHDADTFWFATDKDTKRGRIVAVDRLHPAAGWQTIVPAQNDTLQAARVLGGHFVCTYLADAANRVAVFDLDGASRGDLQLPTLGSVSGFTGRADDAITFFSFQSFVQAPIVLRHDFSSGATSTFRASELQFDSSDIVTQRRFLQSGDGTRLCLFLVHRKGQALDGNHPTYLYGYGGFNISLVPRFSVANLVFVERGGVYAQAILRGGGEYGDAWHKAGMLGHKQNVFDDFAACADYLLRNGFTRPDKLAIGGASNGGLLVGAMLTQRPDLFGAAIAEVGVLDMLRYHKFTIGAAWAPEYGTSDDPEQFAWLYAYSPLHNTKPGTHYPPTLIMTGDHDDRVLPGHSYKFAAALQHAQGGDAPILLRVETSAGHGAGKPTTKLIDEAADRWAFLAAVLGS
ncbi:MAG TPA: prolyl oligopeptidase family serine peptidase [Planctomycetota bacterium]|nr:prolyl oligopeptidase family serine peptidase [Planctomycetota bacterium]